MGSTLSPILADLAVRELETCRLEKLSFKPITYHRYVEHNFCIIHNDCINEMAMVFNSYNQHLQLTHECGTYLFVF